ncbi:MAG TPA: S41 family peptidase [Blastocatellia bacterium]|nr:S41 family peptidase [Blastocatellia bacterium]
MGFSIVSHKVLRLITNLAALICVIAALAVSASTQTVMSESSDRGLAAANGPVIGVKGVESPQAAADPRRESFEIVWRTVKDRHFDPNFGGVNWDQVKQKYLPRLDTLKTDDQFYSMLQEMLNELHESHFAIIPPEAVADESKDADTGGIGIDLRIIDGRAVVSRVDPDSTAAKAGITPGSIIESVGGATVADLTKPFEAVKGTETLKELREVRAVLAHTGGKPGSAVRITWIGAGDQMHDVSVERAKQPGEYSEAIGNFPAQLVEFESKRIAGDIGYIRFNIFVMRPIMEQVRTAIRSMEAARGLIIDLRGNPGGFGGMAPGIAGMLVTEQASLGVMKMRSGFQGMVAFPQPRPFRGPVVILMDGLSASTSEVFAAGLQELGRAVVVGQRSAGAALPSIIQKLPTGALFQYAIADFKTPKGVLIEGRGVTPDIEVKLTRAALLAGTDPQLDAAIEVINKRAGAHTR